MRVKERQGEGAREKWRDSEEEGGRMERMKKTVIKLLKKRWTEGLKKKGEGS